MDFKSTFCLAALCASLTGCGGDAENGEWEADYFNGNALIEEATVDFASLNYHDASQLHDIPPSNLRATWSRVYTVSPSNDPENPRSKELELNVASGVADVSISVNGTEIANWNGGDHSINYTFPEGDNEILVELVNHDSDAMFNFSMNAVRTTTVETLSRSTVSTSIYVGRDSSDKIDNASTISLIGFRSDEPVYLFLSSNDPVNWRVNHFGGNVYFYYDSVRPESSVLIEKDLDNPIDIFGAALQNSKIRTFEGMFHSSDNENEVATSFNDFKPLSEIILDNSPGTIEIIRPLIGIEDSAAKPYYGTWEVVDNTGNREVISVFVQDGALVMRNGIRLDNEGRTISTGILRNAQYTEDYFSSLDATSAQSSVVIQSVPTVAVGSTFTKGGQTFIKREFENLACGLTQIEYNIQNKLLNSPSTDIGKKLDYCVQKANEIYLRKQRETGLAGVEPSVYEFPFYLLYRADLEHSNGETEKGNAYLGLASRYLSVLDTLPPINGSEDEQVLALFNNVAIAFQSINIPDVTNSSTNRARPTRRLTAYLSTVMAALQEEESSFPRDEVKLSEMILTVFDAARTLESNDNLPVIDKVAQSIQSFIRGADTVANNILNLESYETGQPTIALWLEGESRLEDLREGDFILDDPIIATSTSFGRYFFASQTLSIQEYLNAHPGFAFSRFNVHHAVEQGQAYTRLLGQSKLQQLINLRGIPGVITNRLHQSIIRDCWDKLYEQYDYSTGVPEGVLIDYAVQIDDKYGHLFVPPIRDVPAAGNLPECEPAPAQP